MHQPFADSAQCGKKLFLFHCCCCFFFCCCLFCCFCFCYCSLHVHNTKPSGTMGDTQKTMTISATSFRGCNRFSPSLTWCNRGCGQARFSMPNGTKRFAPFFRHRHDPGSWSGHSAWCKQTIDKSQKNMICHRVASPAPSKPMCFMSEGVQPFSLGPLIPWALHSQLRAWRFDLEAQCLADISIFYQLRSFQSHFHTIVLKLIYRPWRPSSGRG